MGNRTSMIDYLQAGLAAASARQAAIASNLANINTPGYARRVVEFEKVLAKALDSPGQVDLAKLAPQTVTSAEGMAGPNGNNVSLETEVGELIKNAATYKTYLRLMAKLYSQMEMAMQTA